MTVRRIARVLVTILAATCAIAGQALGAADPPAIDFNRHIRPILSNNCYKCHGPDAGERKSGLRLDVRDAATAAAESGSPAIVPGQPDQSGLVERIASDDPDFQMPPPDSQKKLTDHEKDLLRQWIAQGASYRQHWSLIAPVRPALPAVQSAAWPRNPIDYFILAKLEAAGLAPSPEADRETLIRRVTLDLTGLPPTPVEIDAFLADTRPDAYERLVDRLLETPQYGERMTLDWLDAARFADTHGYHIDSGRDMSRWRQWVIRAFNANLPFDQFTVEQLAGDLLPDATLDQKIASGFNRNHMINFEGGAIPQEYHNAYIVDRVNTTATVWLGLTVACTQCHDHKYDPLTQREFYQLYAFFHNVRENGLDGNKGNAEPLLKAPTADEQAKLGELTAAAGQLEAQLAGPWPEADAAQAEWEQTALATTQAENKQPESKLPDDVAKALAVAAAERSPEQSASVRSYFRRHVAEPTRTVREQLQSIRKDRDALDAAIPTAMVMNDGEPRPTFVLVRGQYDKQSDPVQPDVPASLPPLAVDAPHNRLGLAQWLVRRDHPLAARVTVNRYWQLFFGTGLVKTAEDFGSQGDPPSHPELLDWLAVEFQEPQAMPIVSGPPRWNVKSLVRLLVTSATYRQASAWRADLAHDPENRLLGRASRLRLPAELIRDQALAASGLLDRRIGGPSVSPYQPAGLWEELMSRADGANWTAQTYVQSHGPDLYRRTMYTFWKRTSPPPTLATFDAPDRETCTVRRARTNTPLQALILWNDPTYVEASRHLAERTIAAGGGEPAARIAFAFRVVVGRQPRASETAVLLALLAEQTQRYQSDRDAATKLLSVGESPRNEALDVAELAAWTMVASAILNLDETVTRG